ncbi:MAG: Hsp70 family protein [Sphingomonas sp.]
MSQIFGIDLGTTYSCIAVVDDHGLESIIPNSMGDPTTPSVVYFEENGAIVVGQSAKEYNKVSPGRVVEAAKRHMGNENWRFEVDGESYNAQEISSLILKKVVSDAEAEFGCDINDVVITCPAYFGVNEREATRQAGLLAGLNVHSIISEPTAAAFAYTQAKEVDETLLVYDLGGGTFDVTVFDCANQKAVAVDGDMTLGGKDWDDAIVSFWLDAFEAEKGISQDEVRSDLDTFQEWMNDAESVKKRLSSQDQITSRLRYRAASMTAELSRAQFEEITAGFLESTIQRTHAVIQTARDKGYAKIDAILLVGGSTFMPQVEERLVKEFNLPIRRKQPNQIVALGAALFGLKTALDEAVMKRLREAGFTDAAAVDPEAMKGIIDDVAEEHGVNSDRAGALISSPMQDVTPKSFGLKIVDKDRVEHVDNIILRNDEVPAEVTKNYFTVDATNLLKLAAYENLHSDYGRVELADSDLLGEVEMVFPAVVPASHPIQVTFRLTRDGLLRIEADDPSTGSHVDGEFSAGGLMNDSEMAVAQERLSGLNIS